MDSLCIYQRHPETYDELVSHEDCEGQLSTALRRVGVDGKDVIELGAGTGRLTRLLAPHVRSVRAFDRSQPMLRVARAHLERVGVASARCTLALADNSQLPLPDACADIAIAGWTYGHQTVWSENAWREPVEAALSEMLRVLRPGGTALVIETLGTGFSEPFQPPEQLAAYYALLTTQWQFQRTWIRTDYEFPSVEVGERLIGFFFGELAAQTFRERGERRLAECTGIWSRAR